MVRNFICLVPLQMGKDGVCTEIFQSLEGKVVNVVDTHNIIGKL